MKNATFWGVVLKFDNPSEFTLFSQIDSIRVIKKPIKKNYFFFFSTDRVQNITKIR